MIRKKIIPYALAGLISLVGTGCNESELERKLNETPIQTVIEEKPTEEYILDLGEITVKGKPIEPTPTPYETPTQKIEIDPEIAKYVAEAIEEIAPPEFINEDYILASAYVESRFNPKAKNKVGARGILQLMPQTWKEIDSRDFQKYATNPEVNIEVGTKYKTKIAKMIETKYGTEWANLPEETKQDLISAAYNGGPTRLIRNDYNIDLMPEETRKHVARVRNAYEEIKKSRKG